MIITDVSRFVKTEKLTGKRIAVAVSGGADSIALFYSLLEIQNQFSLELAVIHVNYMLRGDESNEDAHFVQAVADSNSTPFYSLTEPLDSKSSSIEERARIIRYDFFRKVMAEEMFDCIAVGHTSDDQAETVLFRLLRGTGVHGAAGMEAVRKDGIIRPLLYSSRNNCRNYLQNINKSWREDSSNSESFYKRNLIRNEIVPLLEKVNSHAVQHLAEFGMICGDISRRSIAEGIQSLRERKLFESPQLFHFTRGALSDIELDAIADLLRKRGCSFTAKHLTELKRASERAGKETLLPNGWRVYSSYKQLIFHLSDIELFPDLSNETVTDETFYLEIYSIPVEFKGKSAALSIRTIKPDDKVIVGGKYRNTAQFLKKKGIPSRQRKQFPLLVDLEGQMYLPYM